MSESPSPEATPLSSQDTDILSDDEDADQDGAVICESSILRVVSSSQSFRQEEGGSTSQPTSQTLIGQSHRHS